MRKLTCITPASALALAVPLAVNEVAAAKLICLSIPAHVLVRCGQDRGGRNSTPPSELSCEVPLAYCSPLSNVAVLISYSQTCTQQCVRSEDNSCVTMPDHCYMTPPP